MSGGVRLLKGGLRRLAGTCLGPVLVIAVAAVCSPAAAIALEAKAANIGAAPATQQLPIILPLEADDSGLAAFATAVSTPGSPLYGRYESIAKVARRFGATVRTRREVVRFLRSRGATHVSVDGTGLLAHATMSVTVAQRIFDAPMARFQADDGSRFVAPAARVIVPMSLRGLVQGVVGLDTAPVAAEPATPTPMAGSSGAAPAVAAPFSSVLTLSGTPSGCPGGLGTEGFTPNQYLTAYGYEPLRQRGLEGQGERLALVEIDGLRNRDLDTFAACFGIDRPPYTSYAVGGLKRFLAPGGEATLDFEVADAVAPDLGQIEVFETANSDEGILDAIASPLFIPRDKPAVISNSIGECEPAYQNGHDVGGVRAEDRELEFMASVGISFVAAAGDNGSADCTGRDTRDDHERAVDYPPSSPWATGVGGTNLVLNPANQIESQPVWNDASTYPHIGGGGGFSVLDARPSYQKGVVAPNRRAVPDVAMLADVYPGYANYCTAKPPECDPTDPWTTTGGTSAAAPLLASGLVLVDQDLARHSRELVGFANPLIYHLAESKLGSSIFSDVTGGSNDTGPYFGNHRALGCCTARPGYDEASGWGSVNLAAFDAAANTRLPIVAAISLTFPGGQRPVHVHQLSANLGCDRSCAIGAFLQVTIHGRFAFQVNTPVFTFHQAHTRRIHFHFTHRQETELRAAQAKHQQIFAEAFAYLEGAHGQTTEVSPAKQVSIRG